LSTQSADSLATLERPSTLLAELPDLSSLSPTQRTKMLLKVRWEMASRDPYIFGKHFAFTLDQHGIQKVIKPFPADRPHLRWMFAVWHAIYKRELMLKCPKTGAMIECTGLVGDKCRQIMATWFGCVVSVWDVLFHPGRLVFLQSKREAEALGNESVGDGLLGRCKFIIRHIPGLEITMPQLKLNRAFTTEKIELPFNNSMLWGVPEGGDIIRSHTLSGLFSDECGFQPEFGNAYAAAMPGLRGTGTWLYAISTANPGPFRKLCDDMLN